MKNIVFYISLLGFATGFAQTTKPTNVYPTNLEENMYYEKFDPNTNMVTGIHFMVLSDGDNSRDVTPAFEVTIYLLPEGSTSKDDLLYAKVYKLDGIYHMGSHEFKNEEINLNSVTGLKPGNYRMGVWVNSNRAFNENTDDNATLFRGTLTFNGYSKTSVTTPVSEEKSSWDEWDDEDEEDESEEW